MKKFFLLCGMLLLMCVLIFYPYTDACPTDDVLVYALSADGTSYIVETCSESASGELIIPEIYNGKPVTAIGAGAFSECDALTAIVIPDSVTAIGRYAFSSCDNLMYISIPDSVKTIGNNAFVNCQNLQFKIHNGAMYFASMDNPYAFIIGPVSNDISSLVIHEDTKVIADEAFAYCLNLTELTIGGSVRTIGAYAFANCSRLETVIIPEGVTIIEDGAFMYCSSLIHVSVPSSVNTIGKDAFCIADRLQYNVYDNAKYLGNAGNPYIILMEAVSRDIITCTIHKDTKFISGDAFYGCQKITEIIIPNSVISIEQEAFWRCNALTDMTIGNGVISIDEEMFKGCTSMKKLTIGSSVAKIAENAFSPCAALEKIVVDNNNPNYCADQYGVLFNKDKTVLLHMPVTFSGSYSIPVGVKTINNRAFQACTGLTDVVIPNTVTGIRDGAFSGCTGLTEIVIPDSVGNIGNEAFYQCTGLTDLTIGNGVFGIGEYAFFQCTGLKSVEFGNFLDRIGDYAFYRCTGLTSICIGTSLKKIGEAAFSDCPELKTVYYYGTEREKSAITIENDNASLASASWQYVVRNDDPESYDMLFWILLPVAGIAILAGGFVLIRAKKKS